MDIPVIVDVHTNDNIITDPVVNGVVCYQQTIKDNLNSKDVMKEIHCMVAELCKRQDRMENELKNFKHSFEDIQKLIQSNKDLKLENENLKKNIDNHNFRLNGFEQELLVDNVEVCDINENPNENIGEIIYKLNVASGNDMVPADVIFAHRKNQCKINSGLPRPLVIKFINTQVKVNFMKKCKALGASLNNGIFGNNYQRRPLYVNHQLTPTTSYLLMNVKKEIKNGLFKFVWIQNGKILTRRVDRGPIQQIHNLNHFNDVLQRS